MSVDRIARRAGVARSTVYVDLRLPRRASSTRSRADLLERGGFQRVLDAVADPDPRVHLRDGITGGVRTFAAHRDVFRALVSMAALDPEAVAGTMQRSEDDARRDDAARPAAGASTASCARASRRRTPPTGSGS